EYCMASRRIEFASRICIAFLFIAIVQLPGQVTDANLVGTVVDQSQGVVPGANVEIVNTATNVKMSTTTNAVGEYRFSNLPAGAYDLKTSHTGFSTSNLKGILISLGKTSTANVTLAIGEVATTIEVVETPTLIDTTTAQVGATFGEREAIDSPASSL